MSFKRRRKDLSLKVQVEDPAPKETWSPTGVTSSVDLNIGGLSIPCSTHDLKSVSQLGQGAYGYVDKARHIPSQRDLAVKRVIVRDEAEERSRMEMELHVLRKSSLCPYIVQFYGAMFAEGTLLVCMETMEASFRQICTREKVPEDKIMVVASCTLEALRFLEEQLHLVYHDLKPDNILIHSSGAVKLCDFGVCKRIGPWDAYGSRLGTLSYQSPERLDSTRTEGSYDTKGDVWSLGITLLELATSKHPIEGCDSSIAAPGAVKKFANSPLPRYLSEEFQSFTHKCLAADHSKRPTYTELLQHEFIKNAKTSAVNMEAYLVDLIKKYGDLTRTRPASNPAACDPQPQDGDP